MAFPTSPTDGQTAVVNNITYVYALATNTWTRTPTGFVNIGASGNISAGGNIIGNNIIGNVSGNVTANTAQTVTTNAQPNITSVGTLTSLTSGNIIPSANNVFSLGSPTAQWASVYIGNATLYLGETAISANNTSNTLLVNSNAVVTTLSPGNIATAGYISATGNIQGNVFIGNGAGLTNINAGNISGAYGNANVANYLAAFGSNTISTSGTINSGNITGSYFIGNGSALTSLTGANVTGTVANATYATSAGSAVGTAATVTTNAQPNITSTGTLTSLTVSGNTTSGNLLTGGIVSATGNVTGGNILTAGLMSSTGTVTGSSLLGSVVSATGNVIGNNFIGNVISTTVSATANITGGNLLTGGLISSTGSITTAGIVNTANIYGSAGETIATGGNANINIYPGGSGNIVLPSGNITYINNLATPVSDNDAATKQYVDNAVSTQLSYHQAVTAATTANLATTTSGIITYAQPNGAGNGIGATLTTTGSFNLIDTANVQTVGTRILVKNEGNAVFNGIYSWSNATVIVRTTDADEYGSDSATQLSINDYFFVTSGNVNAGSAWIVDAPVGTITFGTSNITFAQFSSSQSYSAGNGISLGGTVINARVDQVTTAFDGGGNIVVKSSAILTTPNIGAATGTSLSVTGALQAGTTVSAAGNITGGNILTAGIMSSTGNAIHGNILTAGLLSATGNVTGNYILGNGALLTGVITSVANINSGNSNVTVVSSGGNVTIGIGGTANIAVFATTGEYVTGVISASGNITGSNVLTAGLISATSTITSDANVVGGNVTTVGLITATGNITGGNITTVGLITATGNIQAGNIRTVGLFSATGNVTGNYFIGNGSQLTGILTLASAMTWTTQANTAPTGVAPGSFWYDSYSSVKYQYTNDGTGNVWVDQSFPTSFTTLAVTGNATIGGNLGVTGTITYGNIGSPGYISAVGNVTGGNITTVGLVTATGNVTGGNILTAGLISATGAITGGSATVGIGNITVGNLLISGAIIDSAQLDIQTSASNANIVLTPNGSGNVNTAANVSVTGNVQSGNIRTAGLITATGNVTGGNITTANQLVSTVATGTAPLAITSTTRVNNLNVASSNVADYVAAGGAINGQFFVGLISATSGYVQSLGNSNIIANASTGLLQSTLLSATSNITGGNITTAGLITATGNVTGGNILTAGLMSSTGNAIHGNILTAGLISATGNITSGNLSVGTGTITVGNIVNSNANAVGNIGSSSLYFNTVFAKATSALYADLAEMYAADQDYAPGTVVEFGDPEEIRASQLSHSTSVAGIISTNPSYLMNAAQLGKHVLPVALTGRVPCRVVGKIIKGDRLVASDIPGVATVLDIAKYEPSCIIGKALENYDSREPGVIEVAVGRT